MSPETKRLRIVLTGGPGGGKTTAADLFRREIGERVVVVPEAATMLFSGGFPRETNAEAARAAQRAIYYVQRNLEDVQRALFPHRILLCDRGTIDGAAYWPKDDGDFFEHVGSSLEEELLRYDAVIFFETAARGGLQIEGGNPIRNEDLQEAVELDHRLRKLWHHHPHFTLVPHMESFFKKITLGLASLEGVVQQLLDGGDESSEGPAEPIEDESPVATE
jgi:predicted ATPase